MRMSLLRYQSVKREAEGIARIRELAREGRREITEDVRRSSSAIAA